MPFCNHCSSDRADGALFCSECGNRLTPTSAEPFDAHPEPVMRDAQEKIVWSGGPLRVGISSTALYTLTNERLIAYTGHIGKKEEELDLASVEEITVTQKPFEENLGMGDVVVYSTDPEGTVLRLEDVEDPFGVKDAIASAVKQARAKLEAADERSMGSQR